MPENNVPELLQSKSTPWYEHLLWSLGMGPGRYIPMLLQKQWGEEEEQRKFKTALELEKKKAELQPKKPLMTPSEILEWTKWLSPTPKERPTLTPEQKIDIVGFAHKYYTDINRFSTPDEAHDNFLHDIDLPKELSPIELRTLYKQIMETWKTYGR